jgi:hypothetical protein
MQVFQSPFEVMFSIPVESKYGHSYSFRSLNQQDLLAHAWDDEERMLGVRDETDSAPDQYFLYQENPLEVGGYYLQAISISDESMVSRL